MNNSIRIFKNIDELSLFFAHKLFAKTQATTSGKRISLVLSGGSTPRRVFDYLALNFKDKIDWQKVLIFWGDERCVAPENEESNFRMAKESLLDLIPIPDKNIFRIKGEMDPYTESLLYADKVRENIPAKNNIPQFDFLMLGLGDDGHTVSIFPGNLHLFNSDKLFDVAENPYSKQKRITATGKIINNSATIIFLVTGESKAEMVARIIEKKEGWEELPAAKVHPTNGELIWLLDEKAAMKLKIDKLK